MPILDRWAQELEHYPERKVAYDAAMVIWNKKVSDGGPANPPNPREKPLLPPGPGHNDTPGGHFNGMIYPLIPYAIRGAVWYQGESNAGPERAPLYARLFQTMIRDWRRSWGEGDLPFLFVQLPNWIADPQNQWPELREGCVEEVALGEVVGERR